MIKPVTNLKEVMKGWQRIKDEMQDTECCGETFEFLSDWHTPETGTAQHTLWRGCEKIVELCHKINGQINMAYSHPIPHPDKTEVLEELQGVSDWGKKYGDHMMDGYINARITQIKREVNEQKKKGN